MILMPCSILIDCLPEHSSELTASILKRLMKGFCMTCAGNRQVSCSTRVMLRHFVALEEQRKTYCVAVYRVVPLSSASSALP